MPDLKGDGIPTSNGLLRGVISFKWFSNLLGIFALSLSTIFIGVPLGNEGIAVQMGTALGRGSVYPSRKKHGAWDRYAMTGGTCAGFSVATGAPISGIMFSLEEAHQRISPMIIMVSCTSVMFSYITCELIASIMHIEKSIMPDVELMVLSVKDIWIPAVIGIVIGLWSILFLRYYRTINRFLNKKLKNVNRRYKIFAIYAITATLGLVSFSFISTGHDLMVELLKSRTAIYMLLLILFVRCTMSLAANSTGITGGMHLPVLAIGATLASIDTFVTVQKGAFAIGKQIRDIFWPSNLFVLSIKHDDTKTAAVDKHGEKAIREGDLLHVRYSTYDEVQTREELMAIVGEQVYNEAETDTI